MSAHRLVAMALATSLAGCALAPPGSIEAARQPAGETQTVTATQSGPAAALLTESRAARAAGDYARAAAAIERAVRIEPNDPILWLEHGELRLALGDFDQAMTFARRATTLAGSDAELRAAASRLIADANRERARAAAAAQRDAELN